MQDLRAEDYTYQLTPAEVAEIISGTDIILAKGVTDEEDIKKVWGGGSGLVFCVANSRAFRAVSMTVSSLTFSLLNSKAQAIIFFE